MSFTHTFTENWSNGGAPINKSVDIVAGAEVNIDESIAGSSEVQVFAGIDVSALKSLRIDVDKDVQINTNDHAVGSPDDTIDLKANVPLIWHKGGNNAYFACPLTVDVVSIYVNNATAGAVTVRIRALIDPTP
jgi:hypothetical protein